MERIISDEEKIRRAIEISQRRNQNYYQKDYARVNVNDKKNFNLFKKMIFQIVICLLIYLIFYLISTTNYTFSKQVIKSATNILSYDINIEKMYNNCTDFINSKINNKIENNEAKENVINNNIEQVGTTEENIINNNVIEKEISQINTEKEKMQEDANKVKEIAKFEKPLKGVITSEYGEREVTSKVMSPNHKGIDIAAESGTNIKSAMNGVVEQAKENSEYGKFIKITNGEIMTVYAHCERIKVKEGDNIKMGQTIATVGTTGNSTGPHLHFEIRLSNRYINPRYVIEF